jgi:hypothetical protein
VLRDQASFDETDELYHENELPALELWCNARLFRIDDQWTLMDTVGNSQVGVPDVEAVFFSEAYSPVDVEQLLRLTTMYLLDAPDEDIQTMEDENGTTWKLSFFIDSICDPPRQVVRLIPDDGRTAPEV